MLLYLNGTYDYDEMIERGIIATRQLAKRQFTWLRADEEYQWLDTDPVKNATLIMEKFEKKFGK